MGAKLLEGALVTEQKSVSKKGCESVIQRQETRKHMGAGEQSEAEGEEKSAFEQVE